MNVDTSKIDRWGKDVEARVQRWLQTETTFNFLRNTAGRVILAIVSIAALYGYGLVSYTDGDYHVWTYPLVISFVTLLQKISVRYAFDDDTAIDEFQHKRRNRAYRRAYKRVGAILLVGGALLTWQYLVIGTEKVLGLATGLVYLSPLQLHLTYERVLVLGSFLIGLFVIQKYLSWGIKGEPKAS